ncbi:MAG TPA: SRPBCC domain-containing protein, partial [Thermoanaerobaculia bacterium]|nr:SRPBCC domain-containing protein [Thermoanaerobaculia bacterium]
PERIVFTSSAIDGALEVLTTVTFAEEGAKTKMTLQAIVVKAAAEAADALSGMREGWTQTLERLADDLAETFLIARTFDATRDLVWKSWTETDRLMQWFGPKGFTMFHARNDLRPGGTFHYALRGPDGNEMWGKWVYREIVPPERIVLVSSFSDAEGNITRHPMAPTWPAEMLTRTTFTEAGGKTTVTIEWRPLNANEEERNTFIARKPSMTGGWTGTFDQLADYLGRTA